MKNTKWILTENKNSNNNLNLDEDIEKIFNNRELSLDSELNIDPFHMKDMNLAVDRILKAIKNNEKIYIYGDYDVDGITSVSLLYLALTEINANVSYYIPLRDEGYGLNKDAMDVIKNDNCSLVISVDCGINSIEEVSYAKDKNLDFIITDHHEIISDLPKALAVINPKREENIYNFKFLAGVGTAYFLVLALYKTLNKEKDVEKFLDIVAIGTVADVVPLINDNRKLVSQGLKILKNTKWIGIKQLIRKLYKDEYDLREYSSTDIGYLIAPIFNAAGRLEDAKDAVELFIEEDPYKCLTIIEKLLKNNSERKEIQNKIFEMCLKEIKLKELNKNSLILVANKNFHHGVIGIVASKILEKFYLPTIIMEKKEGEGIATASCRSVSDLNIVEALNYCSDLLVKYGGHSGAAGFTIEIDKIDAFYKKILKFINNKKFIKEIKIENIIQPYKVSYNFLNDLKKIEPVGASNREPIFAMKNCKFLNFKFSRTSNEHLLLDIEKDGYIFKNSIFFGGGEFFDKINTKEYFDIAFRLSLDSYKDKFYYKLQLEDIKKSEDNKEFKNVIEKNGKDIKFPIKAVFYTKNTIYDDNISLNFTKDFNQNDRVNIIHKRVVVGYLDENLSKYLSFMKKIYNLEFKVKIIDKIYKTENYNFFIEIDIERDFHSIAINEASIFKDIHKYLLSNFNYNSIQKNILASVFKNKKKTLGIIEYGRGLKTIINTIKIYNEYMSKKLLIFKNIKEYKSGYDFYIYINEDETFNLNLEEKNILILSTKNIEIDNFIKIEDKYKIPDNVEIINFEELNDKENIFHEYLLDEEKKYIISNLTKYEKIYSTEHIKIFL